MLPLMYQLDIYDIVSLSMQLLKNPTAAFIILEYIKTHGSVSCGPRSRRATP